MAISGDIVLQTERLYLRELTADDFFSLCKILQDKEVMYAYEHAFSDKEVTEWLNKQIGRYSADGFGLWAVILKKSGEMIGQCGLTKQDCNNKTVVEIGYLFQKAYWHCGYATESAIACKNYAFNTLHIGEVYSIIRSNNLASQKVALNNGMTATDTLLKHYYNMDMPHIVFSVKNPLLTV
ncbi:MAG: GNAT family N-acetyltransferase [Clostridia bacterium]